ncbi:hypothetical protein GGX14DRAFT_391673 [Mycena pura]|uniref:Uncharacterized protein n=1 Tax=Mycena pura TaxID=153505 RepID=A0AAD6VL20_9AGAR|nr:hypothetical protein GGX14DRAFT_391673 [Mycena pura]
MSQNTRRASSSANAIHPSSLLARLIEYTTLATSTVKEIAQSAHVPFLTPTAAVSATILKLVQTSKTSKEHLILILEHIHEVLCAIISLHSMTAVERVLPPGVVNDIGNFMETLQKVYTFLKAQQEMSKIRQLFKQANSASQLEACKTGLQEAVIAFRVQVGTATVSDIAKLQKDAQQQHEELTKGVAKKKIRSLC